jgi:hypothetical protein
VPEGWSAKVIVEEVLLASEAAVKDVVFIDLRMTRRKLERVTQTRIAFVICALEGLA